MVNMIISKHIGNNNHNNNHKNNNILAVLLLRDGPARAVHPPHERVRGVDGVLQQLADESEHRLQSLIVDVVL